MRIPRRAWWVIVPATVTVTLYGLALAVWFIGGFDG